MGWKSDWTSFLVVATELASIQTNKCSVDLWWVLNTSINGSVGGSLSVCLSICTLHPTYVWYMTGYMDHSVSVGFYWFSLLGFHVVLFVLHSIALLWPNEWEVISRLFIVDQPISIHCFKETTPSGPTTQYTTQPGKRLMLAKNGSLRMSTVQWEFQQYISPSDLCWECRESFLFQQQRDLREYTQATVYIRKVIEDKRVCIRRRCMSSKKRRLLCFCSFFSHKWILCFHFIPCLDDKGGCSRSDGQQLWGRGGEGRTATGGWRERPRLQPG